MIDEDDELLARALQEELDAETALHLSEKTDVPQSPNGGGIPLPRSSVLGSSIPLTDTQWDLIDPNPDIRALFLDFNEKLFWGKLLMVEVKWSPKMTLCAGVCSYEGGGGLCSVRLSAPLLKLRPRKDLVQTLLHEMIHAYLFVTANNRDRDGHGPEFCKHMNRINAETGTKITVYHSFHDEVDVYRQHWWRCDGPCVKRPPYYGIVRRSMNRPPQPADIWWAQHQATCGGTYTKIREPEGFGNKKAKKRDGASDVAKPKPPGADIRSMLDAHIQNVPLKSRVQVNASAGIVAMSRARENAGASTTSGASATSGASSHPVTSSTSGSSSTTSTSSTTGGTSHAFTGLTSTNNNIPPFPPSKRVEPPFVTLDPTARLTHTGASMFGRKPRGLVSTASNKKPAISGTKASDGVRPNINGFGSDMSVVKWDTSMNIASKERTVDFNGAGRKLGGTQGTRGSTSNNGAIVRKIPGIGLIESRVPGTSTSKPNVPGTSVPKHPIPGTFTSNPRVPINSTPKPRIPSNSSPKYIAPSNATPKPVIPGCSTSILDNSRPRPRMPETSTPKPHASEKRPSVPTQSPVAVPENEKCPDFRGPFDSDSDSEWPARSTIPCPITASLLISSPAVSLAPTPSPVPKHPLDLSDSDDDVIYKRKRIKVPSVEKLDARAGLNRSYTIPGFLSVSDPRSSRDSFRGNRSMTRTQDSPNENKEPRRAMKRKVGAFDRNRRALALHSSDESDSADEDAVVISKRVKRDTSVPDKGAFDMYAKVDSDSNQTEFQRGMAMLASIEAIAASPRTNTKTSSTHSHSNAIPTTSDTIADDVRGACSSPVLPLGSQSPLSQAIAASLEEIVMHDCPVCQLKFAAEFLNDHLDECLFICD